MEVTITMLVAAIVISITYTAYEIVSKSFIGFKSKNEDMAVIANVDHLMKRDFERADIIAISNAGIALQQADKPTVYYEFANTYIVRKSITTDTFKVNNREVKMLFEHQARGVSADTDIPDNTIDELSFVIDYQDEAIPCHFYKSYSSVNLIQRNAYAIH